MKANIFKIQKLGNHNSPGIRTVVFFKGCPLRCPWCTNPESSSRPTELLWDRKKCFHGHLCDIHCPTQSLKFENDTLNFNSDTCRNCQSCVSQCPSKALEFAGTMMELCEVMDEIRKDKAAYDEFGGGVTLTGGEVLNQADFAAELLKTCREANIHTSTETSGYASPLTFSKVARHCDLLLFDIKHHDAKEHIKYTGVSQGKILENLDSAVSMHIPVTARIPVIPGVNNSLADAGKFAALLKKHRITTVNLLPFHQSGEKKYESLDRDYQLKDHKTLHLENLEEYAEIFRQEGFDVSL